MKLDLKAFAVSAGIIMGVTVFLIGLISDPEGYGAPLLELFASFYAGFDGSITGSLIGGVYGFIDGAIGGLLFALLYNRLAR